jgi:DNA primase
VQRIQAIYLDAESAGKADLAVKKRSYALAPGSSVNLSRNVRNKQVSYLAEGVETGLSILNSIDNGNVEVVLGVANFKHPSLKNLSKDVVICLDNDGANSASQKAIHEAAQALNLKGKTIWIAMPSDVGRDFNDILKSQGAPAVRRTIDQAILYSEWASKALNPTTTLKYELEQRKLQQLPPIENKELAKTLNGIESSNALSMKILNENESKPMLENHINKLADHLNQASKNINKNHLNIYKSLNPGTPVKEIERTEELTKDIEREI